MSGKLNIQLLTFLCYIAFYSQISESFVLDKILDEDENAVNFIELYIPTMNSNNEKCRNHSLYYLQELRNYTLWATENMENKGIYCFCIVFDATTKFPSGVIYGSSYDFGNFDECLELKIPYQHEDFSGKYCMAKYTFDSPYREKDRNKKWYNYKFDDYKIYFNISMWKKIESCFRSVITLSLIIVILASTYDLLSKRDDFAHIKLTEWILPPNVNLLFKFLIISGKSHDTILCFSFQRNFRKLTSTKTNPDGLDCLAGMKVYSMFLIILLHRQMFDYGSALINPTEVERYYSQFEMTFVLNGPILVDTFFTISGFLATYLILYQNYRSKNGKFSIFLYIHRYIRMTSTYCIILAFYCTLFVKLGNGPLWHERVGLEREKCREAWWTNMLYINNYVDTKHYCMFQSWYMACDMDGFIFVPIICWIIWKKASAGVVTIILAIIASILTVFIVVFLNDEQPILLIYLR
ncbi:hypothetical protein NQ314_004852 [Rhamnusium bicolor]|uniref:Acyltransferase 3 domain-containing protein n=1 Tax=Rhamnusium bicolor TaxID=1586634 RepID=A0AAV8ZIH5_9CUCU|nr:hypothetical protein NQ314_004852 [Rhamnusium bicolor]